MLDIFWQAWPIINLLGEFWSPLFFHVAKVSEGVMQALMIAHLPLPAVTSQYPLLPLLSPNLQRSGNHLHQNDSLQTLQTSLKICHCMTATLCAVPHSNVAIVVNCSLVVFDLCRGSVTPSSLILNSPFLILATASYL